MKNLLMVLAGSFMAAHSIGQNSYGLKTMGYAEYKGTLRSHPEKRLVELRKIIPGLVLDIRYATENNFANQKIYNLARAYARKPVALALKKVQADLKKKGLGLKIFDAYRPYSVTVKFYEMVKDTVFVASPYRGSKHNRGCALDLTMIDLRTGSEMKMPTAYDAMLKEASPTYPLEDEEARTNRDLLIEVMARHGLMVYEAEWWHFDFKGWEKFEVMDIDFEELEKKK